MKRLMMKRVQLKCGRFVAYREYGDLENGVPVLFAHGNLNSRMFSPAWGKTEEVTKSAGVRLIAVDRPGYGGSDFEANRTYLGWVRDMDDFTDNLGLSSFVVAGFSSGGPHALACAGSQELVGPSMFSKVLGVCLISSDGPYALLGDELIEKVYHHKPPVTFEKSQERTRKVYESMKSAYESIGNEDKRTIALEDLACAVEQGFEGPGYDMILETSLWDYDFANLTKPILLWHGEADDDVPVAAGQFIQDQIKTTKHPKSKFTVIPGENHTMIRRKWKEILDDIRESLFAQKGNL